MIIESLHDDALLIKPWISDAEFGRFFNIPSRTAYEENSLFSSKGKREGEFISSLKHLGVETIIPIEISCRYCHKNGEYVLKIR